MKTNFLLQNDGVAMGSISIPTLANTLMRKTESALVLKLL